MALRGETEKQRRVSEGNAARCNPLILEREKPDGYDSLGRQSRTEFYRDHRLEGLLPVCRAKANSMIPL